jgi:hypothetical protein
MQTDISKLNGGFGLYETAVRVNGRLFVGCGHTPTEAYRNAWDAVQERFDSSLQGFVAVMKSSYNASMVERSENGKNVVDKTI